MAQVRIWVHAVWATKNRAPLLLAAGAAVDVRHTAGAVCQQRAWGDGLFFVIICLNMVTAKVVRPRNFVS